MWSGGKSSWNIGLRTGTVSGIFVLDIDRKSVSEDGLETLENLIPENEQIPDTPAQTTGSGIHLFFKFPEGLSKMPCSAGQLGPGLDVRGDCGYVVVAPSMHPQAGRRYQWLPGLSLLTMPPATAPDWLLELILKPGTKEILLPLPINAGKLRSKVRHNGSSKYGKNALTAECHKIEMAGNGLQEFTLNRSSYVIGQIVGAGYLEEELASEKLVCSANLMVSFDEKRPWKTEQIRKKVSMAIQDGKKSPRKNLN